MEKSLPAIPVKRYFTIGEVSELCGVKPYVLRYWEQEFSQLKPMKRRGNRRYYQHHEVLLIRRIRELLYEQGFTINGARNRLIESGVGARGVEGEFQLPFAKGEPFLRVEPRTEGASTAGVDSEDMSARLALEEGGDADAVAGNAGVHASLAEIRHELLSIREMLAL